MDIQQKLEQDLLNAINKVSSFYDIHKIFKKCDNECILLRDEVINTRGFRGIDLFTISLYINDGFSAKHLWDNYPNLKLNINPPKRDLNALFWALRNDAINIAKALIEKGFNINQKLDATMDENTVFMQLCDPKPYMSLKEETLIYALENFSPDLSIKNKKGWSAYDILEKKCPTHCVKNLAPILKNADIILKEKQYLEEKVNVSHIIKQKLKV